MNRAHGRHETHVVGNILLTYFADDFNVEGALARGEDLRRLAPTNRPWAMLNHSLGWGAADAESLEILRQQREWMLANGCVCIASVLQDRFHVFLLQSRAGEFPDEIVQYFYNEKDACAWLSARGFPIQPSDLPPPSWQARKP